MRLSPLDDLVYLLRLMRNQRRILSPLRLPVPPSRHFVEVLYSKAVSLLVHIGARVNRCETVQQTLEVLDDFHGFGSLALEAF